MEPDFREPDADKLFDFSRGQEQLIFKFMAGYSECMIFRELRENPPFQMLNSIIENLCSVRKSVILLRIRIRKIRFIFSLSAKSALW